ncbi:MAG: hypothetical protein ACLTSK_03265 [Christensenellales bacterium]
MFCAAYRRDLESDCDIIEEIIRVYGYDKMVSISIWKTQCRLTEAKHRRRNCATE